MGQPSLAVFKYEVDPRITTRQLARRKFWREYDKETTLCEDCGADGPLEVHHVDGDPFNNDLENLTPLCHSCHRRRHRRLNIQERIDEMWAEVEDLG